MADFNALQAIINAYIKRNGVQAITGQILNGVLTGMVNALGKGYTVAGAASPTTDPGTMTGPLAYIAYTAGTYTHFDNIVVEQGEVSMLIYNEAEWHKEVLFSLAAQATVDDNIGVPSVGVSFVDGILTFNFRNMKGEPGENGQDGDPAGFGTISASISGGVGTPGVSVQSSGPDTAKNIAFQFTNLKGETGVTSCVVTVDNTTGNPSCAVSLVGQELHLDFSGLKGAQGNTGSSVDYPFTIVNNLTTDDPTQALSAAMGVQLESEVSQLEAKVSGLYDAPGMVELYINSNNKWAKSNTKKYLATAVPVQANDVVSLQYRLANVGFRGLFASYPTLGETATNLLASIDAGVLSEEITISQSGYLVIWSFYNGLNSGPLSIIINGRDSTHFIVPVEQQLYQLRTFDSGIKETIDGISEDVNTMSGEVDAIGESVIVAKESADSANKKIGNVEREEITLPISLTINGISGDVGSAINIRTTTGYAYVIFQVSAGDTYSVKTRTGTSNNYPYYVYLTDGNDIIKDRKIAKQSSNAIQEEQVVIPSGVTKMWVLQYEATPTYIVVRKSAIKDLQSQVTEQKETADTSRMISDNGFFGLETDWWIKDRFLEDTYSAQEASALSAFLTKFRARAGQGVFQVGVISDTHGSGAYSWQNILRYPALVCHRSIAVFNKVVVYCDVAFHGGDLSSDYGTSRIRDLQYMYEIARKFCFSKPFFITKGNHDENNNAYIEADMLHLDWTNNTYYVRDFSTFSAVTEDSWDGSPLYVSKTELVSDLEFRNMVQHWLSPAGATWGNGAYYFYDDDDTKIRIIVGNSFPVNDNHQVSEDEEYLWLAQTALNLSEKSNPAEWKVLMLRHTQSTSLTALSNCINAFRTGASWTYGDTSVDFGAMNGGGITFLAHIHGHEHMNCFSNGAGYFDIGENSSFVSLSSLGDASKYGISVLSIDMENGIIFEDTIGGKTWAYNYVTGKLEIRVGDTFRAAPSGLSSPSASSSDTGVATCDGMVVTAVSAGECNITITGSNGSYVYPIKVI